MSSVMLQCTQRNIQIPYSSTDGKWTVLALDLAALLAPVTTAAFEDTKSIQFCANMVVRGAFTAHNSYTRQVRSSFCVQNAPGIFLTNRLPAAVISPVMYNVVCCSWLDWQLFYMAGTACQTLLTVAAHKHAMHGWLSYLLLQNLPKEMVLSHALAPADLNWVWMPQEPAVQPAPLRCVITNTLCHHSMGFV